MKGFGHVLGCFWKALSELGFIETDLEIFRPKGARDIDFCVFFVIKNPIKLQKVV
jgi:hypothetical protein